MTPNEVARFLLDELRGLAWVGGWVKEEFWYEALGCALRERRSVAATTDRRNPYPDGSGYCDLLVPLEPGGGQFWIESKGVWRGVGADPAWSNRNYRGHLLSLSRDKHSALRDVTDKLPRITEPGCWVGEFLVGFDRYSDPIPDADISELMERGGLDRSVWRFEYREWPCDMSFAHRIRVWFWYREVGPRAVNSSAPRAPAASESENPVAKGKAATLTTTQTELTTQEAAGILNVSHPFLVELLDKGEIPYRMVGTHRRILFRDLTEFKQRTRAAQEQALDELVAQAQAEGMGY